MKTRALENYCFKFKDIMLGFWGLQFSNMNVLPSKTAVIL